MRKSIPLLVLYFFLSACSGTGFDSAAFPPEQEAARLAFKRMSEHGRMEPVLEDGQSISDWQFRWVRTGAEFPEEPWQLRDRSGITYHLPVSYPTDLAPAENAIIFLSGEITDVKRDLVAGTVDATLFITDFEYP